MMSRMNKTSRFENNINVKKQRIMHQYELEIMNSSLPEVTINISALFASAVVWQHLAIVVKYADLHEHWRRSETYHIN